MRLAEDFSGALSRVHRVSKRPARSGTDIVAS
jgi:hypothetical protein